MISMYKVGIESRNTSCSH